MSVLFDILLSIEFELLGLPVR